MSPAPDSPTFADGQANPGLPGAVSPGALVDVRRQLHHALQLVAAAGRSFTEAQPGDAHANLGWTTDSHALASNVLGGGEAPVSAALQVGGSVIALLDVESQARVELPIHGHPRTEVAGWLRAQLAMNGLEPAAYLLDMPYEIPMHPVAAGAAFDFGDGTATAELGRWFALAHDLLSDVQAREAGASDVRCWPHHFDIATLVTLDPEVDPETARSVGVGLSPGDEGIAQPYFYVTPWPVPPASEVKALPQLPAGGRWNTEGFTGAVLSGEALLFEDEGKLRERAAAFLQEAVAASRHLLHAD